MKEFMSLREFLLQPHDCVTADPWRLSTEGHDFVRRYDMAKSSYEKYGDDPPIGKTAVTLVSGFGGAAGLRRKIVGTLSSHRDDQPFIVLEGLAFDPAEYKMRPCQYLADRSIWWRQFYIEEEK